MENKNPKVLKDFLDYLLLYKNYSRDTIKEYGLDLLMFFRFLIEYLDLKIDTKDINAFILSKVKESDIIAFLIYLNEYHNNCYKTRRRKVSSIRSFYKWLLNNYPTLIKDSPASDIPCIESTVRLPKYLKLNDIKKITNVFNKENCKNPIRNNVIIILFLNCGLRLSELIDLKIRDVKLNEKYINVIGKGNKERKIYLNKISLKVLKRYLDTKKVLNLDEHVFLSKQNKKLSRRSVIAICKKAYDLAGLKECGYTTHTLRHTAATYLYKSSKDILVVKEFLGHSSTQASMIYTHVENEEIRKAVNSNPLANYGKDKNYWRKTLIGRERA